MSEKNKNEFVDFEETMKRLEQITTAISNEGIKLEEALSLYEEGVWLVRACNKMLEETERKIKILQLSENGELTQEDFNNFDNN